MKKVRLLLPFVCLLAVPMLGQLEHAPTPEQCRADVDSWDIPKANSLFSNEAAFEGLPALVMRNPAVTARMLDARRAELETCIKTDSAFSGRYSQASRAYGIAELGRIADFMQRNNLTAQFYQEDDQGKR